jgi:hypothetical protein
MHNSALCQKDACWSRGMPPWSLKSWHYMGKYYRMWAGITCYAPISCFYHYSKADNLKCRSLWRNDTACRPHSTTQHYSTTLHLTLDTTYCTLPSCRSHFTLTTTGPVHFSSPTAHITTQVQEHYLTSHVASKLRTNHSGWQRATFVVIPICHESESAPL